MQKYAQEKSMEFRTINIPVESYNTLTLIAKRNDFVYKEAPREGRVNFGKTVEHVLSVYNGVMGR